MSNGTWLSGGKRTWNIAQAEDGSTQKNAESLISKRQRSAKPSTALSLNFISNEDIFMTDTPMVSGVHEPLESHGPSPLLNHGDYQNVQQNAALPLETYDRSLDTSSYTLAESRPIASPLLNNDAAFTKIFRVDGLYVPEVSFQPSSANLSSPTPTSFNPSRNYEPWNRSEDDERCIRDRLVESTPNKGPDATSTIVTIQPG